MASPSSPPGRTNPETADTLYLGMDEAGYGPNLGPLVVASTAFRGPSALASSDWWTVFHPFVARGPRSATRKVSAPSSRRGPTATPARVPGSAPSDPLERFIVDDSKRILASPRGFQRLARTVHAVLGLAGCESFDLPALHDRLDLVGSGELRGEHWFSANPGDPTGKVEDEGSRLREAFAAHAVTVGPVRVRAIHPPVFNQRLAALGNKAEVELEAVALLLREQLRLLDPWVRRVVVWADRLGGRRFYRPLLDTVAGDAFAVTVEESQVASVYRFRESGKEVEISFVVKGDGRYLPVAMASMIAKYLRERVMADFNSYWARHLPTLLPTAGYPQDAKRFLNDIRSKLSELGIPLERIWRNR